MMRNNYTTGKRDDSRVMPMMKSSQFQYLNYPGTYPSAKLKDIVCSFCKRKFFIGRDLKGFNSPLLLPCGHATCSVCENSREKKACPYCINKPSCEEERKNLPYNLYVIGLIHAINMIPLHMDAPDISFHVPMNAIARQNFNQGWCSECGMIAAYNCKSCNVLFCKLCFKKLHGQALQHHEHVPLNKNAVQMQVNNSCPNHETEASQYYCDLCDTECCARCAIEFHKNHDPVLQEQRNEALIPEFNAAVDKLHETRIRTHQTIKVSYFSIINK